MPEEYYRIGPIRGCHRKRSRVRAAPAHGTSGADHTGASHAPPNRSGTPAYGQRQNVSEQDPDSHVDEMHVYLPIELQTVFKKYRVEPQHIKTLEQHKPEPKKKKPRIKKIIRTPHALKKKDKPVAKPVIEKQKSAIKSGQQTKKKKIGRFVIADTPPKFTVAAAGIGGREHRSAKKNISESKQSPALKPAPGTLEQTACDGTDTIGTDTIRMMRQKTDENPVEKCDINNTPTACRRPPETVDTYNDAYDDASNGGSDTNADYNDNGSGDTDEAVFAGEGIELTGSVETAGGLAGEYQKNEAAKLGDFLNKAWRTPAGCQDTPPVEIDVTVKYDGTLVIDALRASSVPLKNYAARKFLSTIPKNLLTPIAGLKIKCTFL